MGYAAKLGGKSGGGGGLPSEIEFKAGAWISGEIIYNNSGYIYIPSELIHILLDSNYIAEFKWTNVAGFFWGNVNVTESGDDGRNQSVVVSYQNCTRYAYTDVTSTIQAWRESSYIGATHYYLSCNGTLNPGIWLRFTKS